MADRKAKTITFKLPVTATLADVKRCIEQEDSSAEIIVIQDLRGGQFLAELGSSEQAEAFIDSGLDFHEIHIDCRPPQGYYVNVSVIGLKAYISDTEVITALLPFGETKGEIIRLKYKADHELAGIENGNRLVRMVLTSPSIPYSLEIDGEWCRIIHNNQQRVCSHCHALGHSRRRCPEVICNTCGQNGHLSFDCTTPQHEESHNTEQQQENPADNNTDESTIPASETDPNFEPAATGEASGAAANTQKDDSTPGDPTTENQTTTEPQDTEMTEAKSAHKRPLPSDSDSDGKPQRERMPRRAKISPAPNLENARIRTNSKSTKQT